MSGEQGRNADPVAKYLAPGGDNVKLVYVLYLASVIVGITILIGLIMAYLNRGQAAGTWAESHYTYLIRTFWIGLLYALISALLMIVAIGFLLIFVVLIWGVVRCIKGLQLAANGQPVLRPESWTI
jgi:uncharacterized membrane protein